MKVLVIDDSTSIQLFVVSIIEDLGFETNVAASGEAALKFFDCKEADFPDLVVLDIGLPGIDGYETAASIKDIAGSRHIPIIFLSGSKDPDVLSKCLSVGDDYIAKPFSVEMVAAKVQAHCRLSQLYQQLEQQYLELKRYHQQIAVEHDLVESIFNRHFQQNFVQADNYRYHISPKSVFNGDLLLAAYGPSDNLYILIGDVTGHGLPAAVGALPIYPAFLTMAKKGLSVGLIASELNKALAKLLPDNMLVAATLLELSGGGDQVTIWSGGLPPAVLADTHGNIRRMIEPMHCPLGMLEEHEFLQDVQVIAVGPEDRIYLFTDGVEESRNSAGEMFGDARLHALFDGQCADIYSRILQQLSIFTEGVDQDDDITLVELSCVPARTARRDNEAKVEQRLLPWSVSVHLSTEDIKSGNPVPQIVRLLSNAGGVDVHQDYISTVLSELFSNALEHGLLNLDSALKDSEDGFIEYYMLRKERLEQLTEGFIRIGISIGSEQGRGKVTIEVRDSGAGFDISGFSDGGESDHTHGRGVGIVRELCHSIKYSEGGSCATATYFL